MYSHDREKCPIHFVGVWDTVGAMGIPLSFLGLFDSNDEFYDKDIGPMVKVARHTLAIDKHRIDFEPTIWNNISHPNLKQVWFAGSHTDVGGGCQSNEVQGLGNVLASDYPLQWMIQEATNNSLEIKSALIDALNPSIKAGLHKSSRHIYKERKYLNRPIDHEQSPILIFQSVKERWGYGGKKYCPDNLENYINSLPSGWNDVSLEM